MTVDRGHILLIEPTVTGEPTYPIGLATLASRISKLGFDLSAWDAAFDDMSQAYRIASSEHAIAAIIHVPTGDLTAIKGITDRLRAAQNTIRILLTGIVPMVEADSTLKLTQADGVISQSDYTKLLEQLTGNRERKNNKNSNEQSHILADRKLFPTSRYAYAYRSVCFPFAAIAASKGCSSNCPHCPVPELQPNGCQWRDPEDIVGEIEMLHKDHGICDIHFEDDDFLADPERASLFCAEMRRSGPAIAWELVNGVRPQEVTAALLEEIASAGCRRICLGIETTGSHPRSEASPLWQPAEQISKIAKHSREMGISTTGYFIVGLPGASLESDRAMIATSGKLHLDMVHYTPFQMIPGSNYWQNKNKLKASYPEAVQMAESAYRRFYLHPRRMAELMAEVVQTPALAPELLAKGLTRLGGISTQKLMGKGDAANCYPPQY